MITLEDVKNNTELQEIIKGMDIQSHNSKNTEYSIKHASIVSNTAGKILETLGYDKRKVEVIKIAGYLHDIGNIVNAREHPQAGALLAYNILDNMGMNLKDRIEIMSVIGNHEEQSEAIVSDIAAALIIADKTDVCRERVVNTDITEYDRANYAVTNADLSIDSKEKKVSLNLTIDNDICSILEYFEVFLNRAIFCKKASEYLKVCFELIINDTKLL